MVNITRKELMNLELPLRYTGGEYGIIEKPEYDVKIRVALCYPNLYDVGVKNYSVNFLYNAINAIKNIKCERCFLPYVDFENILKEKRLKLYTLESKKELEKFDFVIFVISDITDYINVMAMIKMSRFSNSSSKRPIFIAAFEKVVDYYYPIADIFDILVFADMKVVYNDILFRYSVYTLQKLPKSDFFSSINNIPSVIIPSIDCNKKVILDKSTSLRGILSKLPNKIVISNISEIKQDITILFINLKDTLEYTLKLIKSTGIKRIKIIVIEQNYEGLYQYITSLLSKYNFLKFEFERLPFNDKTIDIYTKTGLLNSKIEFNIPNFSTIKDRTILDLIISNMVMAFENGVSNICLNTKIGLKKEGYNDLEELVRFINNVKEIYFTRFLTKGKTNLNITLKLDSNLECDVDKIELKYKFIEERLNGIKIIHDSYIMSIIKKILTKKDTSLINFLIKLEKEGVRLYKNYDNVNVKLLDRLNGHLDTYIKEYLN